MTARIVFASLSTVIVLSGLTILNPLRDADPSTDDAVIAARIIRPTSFVAGRIIELPVREGGRVRKGDLLMRIDPAPYLAAMLVARARFDAASAERMARAEQLERSLGPRASKAETTSAWSSTQATLSQEKLRLAVADANLRMSAAALDLAKLDLDRLAVRASVDGYVEDVEAKVGDIVEPGTPVIGVVDVNAYRVDAYFEQAALPRIAVGTEVTLRAPAAKEIRRGRIRSIAYVLTDSFGDAERTVVRSGSRGSMRANDRFRVPVEIAFEDLPANYRPTLGTVLSATIPSRGPDASSWRQKIEETIAVLVRQRR